MNTILKASRVRVPRALGSAIQRRTLITLEEKTIYHAFATSENSVKGGTVSIHSRGNEAAVDLPLSYPKTVGGSGQGHNPEQLVAAGHAACLLQVLQNIAQSQGRNKEVANARIHAEAILGKPTDRPGWGFQVNVKFEGVAQDLIDATHEACPFSRMEREGIVCNVSSV